MTERDRDVLALLDRLGGPIPQAPVREVIAAGRLRRRRRQTGALALAVSSMLAASVGVAVSRSGGSGPQVTIGPAHGPTARQLSQGKWVKIPKPPIKLCDPLTVAVSSDLYVVEYGLNKCDPAAAIFDAQTNTWTRLPSPPAAIGQAPAIVWAGDRLVVVAPKSGATFSYEPSAHQWTRLASIPNTPRSDYASVQLLWTGQDVIANVAVGFPRDHTIPMARTYELGSSHLWQPVADLPEPAGGAIVRAPLASYDGDIYTWIDVAVAHDNPNDSYISGGVSLLRLTGDSWQASDPKVVNPKSSVSLTTLGDAILATGSECPGIQDCTEEAASVSLTRPGPSGSSTELDPPLRTPYPRDMTAGSDAVVVTYPDGANAWGSIALPGQGPQPGATSIYDVGNGRWLKGPQAPTSRRTEGTVTWTSAGPVLLTTTGGWLLRPGH